MNAIRKRTAELLEAQRPNDPCGRAVDLVLIVLIFANIFLIVLETDPEIGRDGPGAARCPHCGADLASPGAD